MAVEEVTVPEGVLTVAREVEPNQRLVLGQALLGKEASVAMVMDPLLSAALVVEVVVVQ